MTLFADVVATSEAAAATSKRTAKVAAIAGLLQQLDPSEVVPAVGFLTGVPRQGRIGVGWATVAGIDVPHATEPSLSIGAVDEALGRIAVTSGPGSTAARSALLGDLFGRATDAEA